MKSTYLSHDPPRFRFPDPAGSWSFVENIRPQLEATYVYQVRQRPEKNASLGLRRPDTTETDYREVFEDPCTCKSGSVAPLTSWKDVGSSRRLLRSRSLIRTNPWMSSTGQSPPRSPAEVHLNRCWSAVETGTSSSGSFSPPDTQIRPTALKNEAMMSSRFYRREDSLLTTSVESDSQYQSLTSDTDTATSLMSVSDVTLPEIFKDERDIVSGGSSTKKEIDPSIFTREIRYDGDHDRREFSGKKFDSEGFETDRNRSKEAKKCGRTSFNLQLKRPSFGGKRFSEIADDYEAKTTKWLSSGESGVTTQQSHTRSTDTSVARGDDFVEQLNSQPSTHIQQEILTDREEFDIPTYETPFSSSLQFRRKIMAVRSSLQDKVAMLRREKRVVDEKIREAKEEDKIRLLQLDKFRRQLSCTRKEILLRTIEELKRTLNEQSLKLQKLYDIVLLEQRGQMLCCH